MASDSWNASNANDGYEIEWGPPFNPPNPWDERWDEVMAGIEIVLNRNPRAVGQRIGETKMYVRQLFSEPPMPFADLYYTVYEEPIRKVVIEEIRFGW